MGYKLDRCGQKLVVTNINKLWDVLNQEWTRIEIQTIIKLAIQMSKEFVIRSSNLREDTSRKTKYS